MGACADNLTTESHNAANPLGMSLRFCVHGSPIIHILIVVDVTLCSRQTGAVHLAHELFELSLELGVAILLLEVATYRNACGVEETSTRQVGQGTGAVDDTVDTTVEGEEHDDDLRVVVSKTRDTHSYEKSDAHP